MTPSGDTRYPPPGDLAALRETLVAASDPSKAPEMESYLKNQFPMLGVGSVPRRAAQKEFMAAKVSAGPDACVAAAHRLWAEPEREFQYVGCDLLRRVARRLPSSALGDVRELVATKSWWDTVDSLAKVVGTLVTSHPQRRSELDDWVVDDDMWVARAAILHQLSMKQDADPDLVFRYCEAQIGHSDFFIRKAIGWALRDLARSYPDEVWQFVDSHPDLSPLSVREATKHR
ncbi:MAG: DNA alkylation repair protein [Actinomycetia bacterium]|nr:DNA alkylation repair protein [Actinomycetes bacterium]